VYPRDNVGFAVTDLAGDPGFIYANVYTQSSDVENRIKELKNAIRQRLIKLGTWFKTTAHRIVIHLRETPLSDASK